MTRLHFLLHAKTIYNVHSPFVFDLCQHVLFARVRPEVVAEVGRRRRIYHSLCHKLKDYFNLSTLLSSDRMTLLGDSEEVGEVLIVCRPHADITAEKEFEALCDDKKYSVTIDLYDAGVLFTNRRLHKQHFVLRDGIV